MKIAHLSAFYPFRGGIAQFNAALYRELEKSHITKAFTFKRQYPDLLFPGSSQYVTAEDKADPIASEPLIDTVNPITYFKAAKEIKKFSPELLLMKFWMPFFAPSLGVTSYLLKKKCKVITILDNVIPHEKRLGDIALTKFFLNQNHAFVVMSETVKNDLLKLKPDAKYIYHPHPLYNHFGESLDNKTARKKLNIGEEKKVILFFGFIRDYKGLDLLIKAMKNTPDDFLLIIAGEVYGNFDKYQQLINDQSLQHKIQLHVRYISDNEVPLFFSAADVCILPYKSATQSGITSIAYHFNLPIIATNVGGLQESIKNNITGLVVEEPAVSLINEALIKYFNTEMLKNKMIENIQEYKKELSWSSLANSIINLTNSI